MTFKLIAIADILALLWVAPLGWQMANNEPILQVAVIVTYLALAWIIYQITKEAFNN